MLRRLMLWALPLLAAGCGGGPTSPDSATSLPRFRLAADPVVVIDQGSSAVLRFEELGPGGVYQARNPGSVSWSSSHSALAAVGASGEVRAASDAYGQATITGHADDGDARVLVWVQPPSERPSSFRVTLVFSDDVEAAWRNELHAAAERWQSVIRAELPATPIGPLVPGCSADGMPAPGVSGEERGVRIWVSVSTFSETDSAEAIAAQCATRSDAATTTFGRIVINGRRTSLSASRLRYLALHEMGHTLGLVGVLPNEPWDRSYALPMALEGYRREFGHTVSFLSVSGAHWDLGHDVMGSLRATIDQVTIGALMDAGYPAAWYAADLG